MIRIRKKNKTSRRKLNSPASKVGKTLPEKKGSKVVSKKENPKRNGGERSGAYAKNRQRGKPRAAPAGKRPPHSGKRSAPLGKPREPLEKEEHVWERGEFVLPGELVGTSEEFKAREGTTLNSGDIFSTATGWVMFDRKDRSVSVQPVTSTPNLIKVGDLVYGRISGVRESGAAVEIAGVEGRTERDIVNLSLGDIHVSNVRDSYVKRLANEFKVGDLVRAKVIDVGRMRLSTDGETLGVMKAYCSNCRGELVLEGKKLKCPQCNKVETRKLSADYGKGIY
ncbi:MAG: exosome complex RNA-binding protein Csl4 [Methanosarcinaceae archaeon]|nr:exosome complex RNA-binding protein Csl4 [Methanosarcinaceae archaeon]